MPRTLIAILLFISLSFQSFVKLGVVVWYECNKAYIAKNLCENRDKPQKKCCGKCVLQKQLKKADAEPQGTQVPAKWQLGESFVFIVPNTISLPFHVLFYPSRLQPTDELFVSYSPLLSVFRPPLAA